MKGILENAIELHRYYDLSWPGFISRIVYDNGECNDKIALSDNEMDAFKQLFPHIKIITVKPINLDWK